jgi:hypothetical protein
MKQRLNHSFIWMLAFIAIVSIAARVVPPLQVKASSKKINLKNEASLRSGTISSILGSSILKNQKEEDVEFRFFAKNNISSRVFELANENYNPLKPELKKNAKGEWLIFTASFKELFYKEPGNSAYKWNWEARPEPPSSPVADVRSEKVKTVQCWFTVTVKGKTHKSKTISLDVIQ